MNAVFCHIYFCYLRLSFLQARFEIQKLRFYEVMGINPEEAKRVPAQNTVMTAPMQTGRLKKTKPSLTYDPIISALSRHFGKNLICNTRTVGEQTLCPTVFRKKNHVIITFSWVFWIGNIKTLN